VHCGASCVCRFVHPVTAVPLPLPVRSSLTSGSTHTHTYTPSHPQRHHRTHRGAGCSLVVVQLPVFDPGRGETRAGKQAGQAPAAAAAASTASGAVPPPTARARYERHCPGWTGCTRP
jgi:hypothetical protein